MLFIELFTLCTDVIDDAFLLELLQGSFANKTCINWAQSNRHHVLFLPLEYDLPSRFTHVAVDVDADRKQLSHFFMFRIFNGTQVTPPKAKAYWLPDVVITQTRVMLVEIEEGSMVSVEMYSRIERDACIGFSSASVCTMWGTCMEIDRYLV